MTSPSRSPVQFSKEDVVIIKKETLFQGFFNMVKYVFKHRHFEGGWSSEVSRELFERGPAVAILPYDPVTDQVVLIEQIRVGALEHQNPWQLEVVAGVVEANESVEDVAYREAQEEAGIVIQRHEKVTTYYPSSGGCDEQITVFIGQVDASSARGIHGLAEEHEDIKVHVVSRETAYEWVKVGRIENGASIIAIQWLALNLDELRGSWLEA